MNPSLGNFTGADISRSAETESFRGAIPQQTLGAQVKGAGHIALVVRDVGISLDFYRNVLGLPQIARPNFDRHGAWLSLGSLELHLIKGIPHTMPGQHPNDLIVTHLALEVKDAAAVLLKLTELQKEKKVNWRQNVSVPTRATSLSLRFESDHSKPEGMVSQFFLEDPDGYWLEICNCGSHEDSDTEVSGIVAPRLSLQLLFKMVVTVQRWVKRARALVSSRYEGLQELARLMPVLYDNVDCQKLGNLLQRRNTYGDIFQGYSESDLRALLAKAGNNVPGAVLILKRMHETMNLGQLHKPPSFLNHAAAVVSTKAFRIDHG